VQALIKRLKGEFPDVSEEIKDDEEHQSYRIEAKKSGTQITMMMSF